MTTKMLLLACVCAGVSVDSFGEIYGDVPDAKHAWAVHDWNCPKPAKVEPGCYVLTTAPSDAAVILGWEK